MILDNERLASFVYNFFIKICKPTLNLMARKIIEAKNFYNLFVF